MPAPAMQDSSAERDAKELQKVASFFGMDGQDSILFSRMKAVERATSNLWNGSQCGMVRSAFAGAKRYTICIYSIYQRAMTVAACVVSLSCLTKRNKGIHLCISPGQIRLNNDMFHCHCFDMACLLDHGWYTTLNYFETIYICTLCIYIYVCVCMV